MNNVIIGDCRAVLPSLPKKSVQCVVTSPPYYNLRDYGVSGQIGQESHYQEYIENIVDVFRKIKPVLKDDGTVWLNLGDSYAGSSKGSQGKNQYKDIGKRRLKRTGISDLKPKDLIGIPWRVAFALQKDGWYLRQDIIWHKPNAMPEPVKDRCVNAHEYIFLLSKSKKYYFNYEAIQEEAVSKEKRIHSIIRNRELGYKSKTNELHSNTKQAYILPEKYQEYDLTKRRKRDVWTVHTKPYTGAHFAAFPPELIHPCILAGSREGDTVLDPFFGSGTVAEVAALFNRNWIGIDINENYAPLYKQRLGLFA